MKIFSSLLSGFILFCSVANAQPSAVSNGSAGTGTRKINLQPGQQFKVEHAMNSNSSMEMMGQTMDIKADVSVFSDVQVAARNGDVYKLVSTIRRMTTSADMMGQSMEYDSDKPGDNDSEIGKTLKDKINQPTDADLTEDGKVTVQKKEGAGGAASNPLMSMMGGAEDETNGLGDIFLLIPQNGKTGDTWSDSLVTEGTRTNRTYTIKSINGDEAVVTVNGVQAVNKTVENQGMEVKVELNNKLTGETTVNTATGLIKQRSLVLEGSGTTEVMGQSIPMTTKVTTQSTVQPL